MKKLVLILTFFLLLCYNDYAGERVEGARIYLLQSENQEVWAMNHTGMKGEFVLYHIPPGNYTLMIKIPFTSFTSDEKEKEKLDQLIDGGCDKENGRMVFKLNDNCFVFDINCEDQQNSLFIPYFKIVKQETDFVVTIATAEIKESFDLKGMFQSLTVQYYKKCLESGKFKLTE